MGDRITVTLDETRCVGSGDCALTAPSAFEIDEDEGLARVLPGAVNADWAHLERAARDCPTGAIELTRES